jgi:hypothetical protein
MRGSAALAAGLTLLLGCASLLGGCGSPTVEAEPARPTVLPSVSSSVAVKSVGRGQFEESGRTWPLLVGSGFVTCSRMNGQPMLTFMPTGQTLLFALNGTAKATKRFQDIDAYWADDPDIPRAKVSMSDLTDYGLTLC